MRCTNIKLQVPLPLPKILESLVFCVNQPQLLSVNQAYLLFLLRI